MNIFIFSILIFFSTEAMIDVGLAGLSQMKVSVRYYGQTLAGKDSESPGSTVSCLSGQADRQRATFHIFGQNPDSGQTPDRSVRKIRTTGQQTDAGQDFPENPDKNQTWTGHGPPMSDYGENLSLF